MKSNSSDESSLTYWSTNETWYRNCSAFKQQVQRHVAAVGLETKQDARKVATLKFTACLCCEYLDFQISREVEETVQPTWRQSAQHILSFKAALQKPEGDGIHHLYSQWSNVQSSLVARWSLNFFRFIFKVQLLEWSFFWIFDALTFNIQRGDWSYHKNSRF